MDLTDVKMIVELARQARLSELEVETEGLKVRVKKELGEGNLRPRLLPTPISAPHAADQVVAAAAACCWAMIAAAAAEPLLP